MKDVSEIAKLHIKRGKDQFAEDSFPQNMLLNIRMLALTGSRVSSRILKMDKLSSNNVPIIRFGFTDL
jgi:hypothetical protein